MISNAFLLRVEILSSSVSSSSKRLAAGISAGGAAYFIGGAGFILGGGAGALGAPRHMLFVLV